MGSVEVRKVPRSRRMVTEALKVGRGQVPIHGMVDVDVTTARERLKAADPPLSMTAFVAAAVGRAAARHPEVHAYLNWRGRLVIHRHVDLATLFEVTTPAGTFPLAHLIVDAHTRSVAEISEEIRAVKHDPSASPGGRVLRRGLPVIAAVPGVVGLGYRLASRSVRLRARTGTVALTSVGMFGGGGGFGISAPTIQSLAVVVGGITSRPRVVDGRITSRQVMDLTITVDHRIVDGAPAARFTADLRQLLESDELL